MLSSGRLRADALACYAAALAAVDVGPLIGARFGREDGQLHLLDERRVSRARHAGPVLVVGAGKAALGMARAALREVSRDAAPGGVVIVPHDLVAPCGDAVTIVGAAHPVPDAAGLAATERLLRAVRGADGNTLVLVVLSGGASSLLVAPTPGVSLADKRAVTERLLASGVGIGDFNAVRKHCSQVKGGGLARAAAGAAGLWAFVLSDVPGDDPATIASGPTVGDPSTFADAARVLGAALRPADVPDAVRARIDRGVRGEEAETLKPGDPLLARTATVVIGTNADARRAAAAAATARGYATEIVTEPIVGDAAAAGRALVARLAAAPRDRAVALIAGGETTVRVVPGGRGGRCHHFALAAALALVDEPAVLLAAGTDGVDGPTDAAGACVDGSTVVRARAADFDPDRALAATDSHRLLAATGDLVRTGPTGTNVADVVVALRSAC